MIKSEPALSAFDQDGNLIGQVRLFEARGSWERSTGLGLIPPFQLTSPLKPPAGFEMFEDMGEVGDHLGAYN